MSPPPPPPRPKTTKELGLDNYVRSVKFFNQIIQLIELNPELLQGCTRKEFIEVFNKLYGMVDLTKLNANSIMPRGLE